MVREVKVPCSSLSQELAWREQREVLARTGSAPHLAGWHGDGRLWSQLLQKSCFQVFWLRGFSIDYSSPLKSKQRGRALERCILIL